ncbi:MAG: Sapep family Mn(2+)-dependent dipeptidase [Clostridia bacterium]|nr:Sapep family Mn(2+)-dependent dipeptidase [Clostridia bacterium]
MNYNEFLTDLKRVISINSINANCGEVTENAPLGKGINDAIEEFLSIGNRMGMKTKNLDGYCGYIEIGEGEKMVGIIAHADTVETGDGWDYDALSCTVTDDGVYGRGVADDKGPALLALYAMKEVMDSGKSLNKRVRLIIGGDEESGGNRCINRYKESEETPSVSFSPDADYPVVFGEKGILRVRIFGEEKNIAPDFKFEGGKIVNIVPEEAHAFIDGKALSAKGKSAHGSTPELGENAILKLAPEICARYPESTFARLVSLSSAQSLGIDIKDEMTRLTINPAIMVADSKNCSLSYDIRYPLTANGDAIMDSIKKAVEEKGLCVEFSLHEKPLYVPRDSHLVTTLTKIYEEHTDFDPTPIAIGGGTYAKAFPNCVAFGIIFPGEDAHIHGPNEFWSHESIKLNFDIIKDAILRL